MTTLKTLIGNFKGKAIILPLKFSTVSAVARLNLSQEGFAEDVPENLMIGSSRKFVPPGPQGRQQTNQATSNARRSAACAVGDLIGSRTLWCDWLALFRFPHASHINDL